MTGKSSKNVAKVRLKATQRKGRTTAVNHTARVPTQERSKRRYQAIISATEHLLISSNIEDISLYDIASQADLAPASVHYLFSTVAAIHVELNRIYNIKLTERILERHKVLAATPDPSWQGWTVALLQEGRNALNGYRPMAEVMLGPTLHRASRLANLTMNASLAQSSLALMQEVFLVPEIPNLDRYFMFATEISEALWAGSYSAHGNIGDETFEESVRATISYLRCFLPETLTVKPRA